MCGQGFCSSYYWGLDYHRPQDLSLSQWQKKDGRGLYLVYRILMFLFVLGNYVAKILDYSNDGIVGFFYIYLTNWGLALLFLHMLGDLVLVCLEMYFYEKKGSEGWGRMTAIHKINWFFFTSNVTVSFFITVFYWGFLFDSATDTVDYFNVYSHAGNSIINLIDLFVVAKPIRIQHFYMPSVYGLSFTLWSLIYFAFDGTDEDLNPYIYSKLDWANNTELAIACTFGALALILILHCGVYGLYRLRLVLAKCCCGLSSRYNKEISPGAIEPIQPMQVEPYPEQRKY